MQSESEIELINARLKEAYGRITDTIPVFRVVWSEDQHEYRKGKFVDHYNGIFLREVNETRYVKKYPHVRERWILEKHFPILEGSISELPGITHSYEPLFVFQSASGAYLPPVWYVCQSLIQMYLFSEKQAKRKESDDLDDYQKEIDKEAALVYDFLDDLTPELVSALEHGEAVVVPHAYQKESNGSNNCVDVPVGNSGTQAGSNPE